MSDRPPLSHLTHASLAAIDRITLAELDRPLLDARLDPIVAGIAIGRETVEHLDDHAADLLELGDAEAARGAGRRAEPDARGHHRLLRIERHAILVAGD